MWKRLLPAAVFFFASIADATEPPRFTQTSPINLCVFENGIVLPCFTAEQEDEKNLLIILNEKGEIFLIVKVENGTVVKTLWRKDWVSL